jgi:hypothetical protein
MGLAAAWQQLPSGTPRAYIPVDPPAAKLHEADARSRPAMIRPVLSFAALTAVLTVSTAALAAPQTDVAGAFIAAAKSQDRKAVTDLLAPDVAIEFPAGADKSQQGYGEGQPFVIGYLDGLFDAKRGLSVDDAAPVGDTVRFLAHDQASKDRYAIEVEVRNHQVVKVTVNVEDNRAVATIGSPAS